MKTNITIIIIIAIIVVVVLVYYLCKYCAGYQQISHFTPAQSYQLGYANANDPYDKPFILQHFITPEQCQKIISFTDGKLFDSEVIGGKHKDIRNSQQYWIPKNDPLVKPMFEHVSKMFNIPFENAEDLQVVRYLPNQYYNEHHDACCDNNDKCLEFVRKSGQRVLTVLIYLNNEFEDGNTYFKNLNLKVKPPTGDAIAFFPLAKGTNKCHPLALHAGMPVSSGTKWVANLWFRESKFTP
jgi:prolyl 4-hydroxylase